MLQINNLYILYVYVTGFLLVKTSFRRVKEEDIAVDPRLKDNSFEAKVLSLLSVIMIIITLTSL